MATKKSSVHPGRTVIASFLLPSILIILLFVYVPLIFALLVSLYENPSTVELSEQLLKYYTDTYNLNWIKLRVFFADLWDNKFFFVFGAVGIILGMIWGVPIAKKLGVEEEAEQVFSSLLVNVTIAPFAVYLGKIILLNLPDWVKLPIQNYDAVLTNSVVLDDFLRILFNTVFWTVACTFFHIVFGITLAVLLNGDYPGRGFLRTTFILPWAIPSFITALIWKNYIFNHERGVLGQWAKNNIPTNSEFHVTIADFVAAIIIFLLLIQVFNFSKNRFGSSPLAIALSFIAFFLGTAIIVLVIQANTTWIPLLGTSVFSVTNTQQSFWFTSDFYFFNIRMKMITVAAILTNIWLGVPFMMVSFLAALQAIPDDLYEAAEIDGASEWTKFTAITFPLIRPTLRTVALLGIIWTFNLFNVFYILSQNQTGIGRRTYYDIFITYIYYLFQQGPGGTPHYAYAASLSFVVFLLLVGFSKAYQAMFRLESEEPSVTQEE